MFPCSYKNLSVNTHLMSTNLKRFPQITNVHSEQSVSNRSPKIWIDLPHGSCECFYDNFKANLKTNMLWSQSEIICYVPA